MWVSIVGLPSNLSSPFSIAFDSLTHASIGSSLDHKLIFSLLSPSLSLSFFSLSLSSLSIHPFTVYFLCPLFHLSSCSSGDFVKLYLETDHGSGVTSSPFIQLNHPWTGVIFCGKIPLDAQSTYYSSSNQLLLQFSYSSVTTPNLPSISSSSIPLPSGFSGWYKFVNRSNYELDGEKLSGTLCDYEFLRIDSTTSKLTKHKTIGKFYSPNYPSSYGRGLKCAYHFMAKYNERVKVTFEKIDLANDDLR